MIDYWTITTPVGEMIAIMKGTTMTLTVEESRAITRVFGRHAVYWLWGDSITEVEFETYREFGIKVITL